MLKSPITPIPIETIIDSLLTLISIQGKDRIADFVIRDEQTMEYFITFLCYNLNTVDGYKNSAKPYLDENCYLTRKALIEKVVKKYRVMKWRMKISCMALQAKKTVKQMFLDQILKSY